MPNRSPAARQLIDSLPEKEPDEICNARTPSGYCKMPAGFRTDHLGGGRCYLHGGRAGRSVSVGLYSKKLTSTVKDEYEKLVTDPALIDLYSEFAVAKAMMMNFIENMQERLAEHQNIWITTNRFGETMQSPEGKTLMNMFETISRLFTRITDAETKSANTLNMKQVQAILTQIKTALDNTCGECPVRYSVGSKLNNIKAPTMGE